MMIEVGSKLTDIEVPQKEGYRFLYWAMDGYEFDMNTVIDSLTNEIIKIKTEVYNRNFEYNETLKKCEKMIVPDKIDTALDYYLNNVLTF